MSRWNLSRGNSASISLELRGLTVPNQKDLTDQVELLYEEHYRPVYRYLVLTGSRRADADEALQEAFLRLLRVLGSGQEISRPRNWLLRVCHNLRQDALRRQIRGRIASAEEIEGCDLCQTDPDLSPEAQAAEHEQLDRVRQAMGQLSARQREYLLLRAEGMKLREIAELHGTALQSVAESCARAMQKLGKLIHE
jgi:RNA polymerase sigma-70 factor (ECF subfamily)